MIAAILAFYVPTFGGCRIYSFWPIDLNFCVRAANRLIIFCANYDNNSLNSFWKNVGLPNNFANGNQKFKRTNHRPMVQYLQLTLHLFLVNFYEISCEWGQKIADKMYQLV